MFEKVNPKHPDKVSDRIAGAIVDLAYLKKESPKIAVEVLAGHGVCHVIIETDVEFKDEILFNAVQRIAGEDIVPLITVVPQDTHLAKNQDKKIRCGDNGIFKGVPVSKEEKILTEIAKNIYSQFRTDGKYIIDDNKVTICQSNATNEEILAVSDFSKFTKVIINPLGYWTGGLDVDTGATNRKLGSDMGRGVTGGGLHGKDLSKADVAVNIYAHVLAQERNEVIELSCSIGDEEINGVPYSEIVNIAKEYIDKIGGFEKLAEWGLI